MTKNKEFFRLNYFNIKNAITVLVMAFFFSPCMGQTADKRAGNWIGASNGLPIYFRISGDSLSGFNGDWNSPAQKALGLKCKSITMKNDSLIIETTMIVATYRGRYLPGIDSVVGTWTQGGKTISLNLKRMRRPQTPKPPFNYRADSVEYDN